MATPSDPLPVDPLPVDVESRGVTVLRAGTIDERRARLREAKAT